MSPESDEIGTSSKGAGEDVIVVGVGRDHGGHILLGDQVGEAAYLGHDTLRCQADLPEARGELLTRESIEQLCQEYRAGARLEDLTAGGIEQAARVATR